MIWLRVKTFKEKFLVSVDTDNSRKVLLNTWRMVQTGIKKIYKGLFWFFLSVAAGKKQMLLGEEAN